MRLMRIHGKRMPGHGDLAGHRDIEGDLQFIPVAGNRLRFAGGSTRAHAVADPHAAKWHFEILGERSAPAFSAPGKPCCPPPGRRFSGKHAQRPAMRKNAAIETAANNGAMRFFMTLNFQKAVCRVNLAADHQNTHGTGRSPQAHGRTRRSAPQQFGGKRIIFACPNRAGAKLKCRRRPGWPEGGAGSRGSPTQLRHRRQIGKHQRQPIAFDLRLQIRNGILQRKPAGPAVQPAIAGCVAGIRDIIIQLTGQREGPDRIERNIAESLAEIAGNNCGVIAGIMPVVPARPKSCSMETELMNSCSGSRIQRYFN